MMMLGFLFHTHRTFLHATLRLLPASALLAACLFPLFLLVCGFIAVMAFLTFHYWVQCTWISSFLHGRCFDLPWPWSKPGSNAATTGPG